MGNQFCQKCRRAMYSGEFHLDLCRDCEVDGLKAEIERLKTELAEQNECHIRTIKQNEDTYQGLQEAARKEIERLENENKNRWRRVIQLELACSRIISRAAAWKRCAKTLSNTVTKCFHGFIEKDEFIIIRNRDLDEIVHTKAPPDWREKWVRPASEDKSGINEPKTGARAPITKRNRVSKN